MTSRPHIAVLGAGPTGLEAGLAAADAGRSFTVYEAGDRVGTFLGAWGHVRLFSPWDIDVSPRMRRHLAAAGFEAPTGEACPTGDELRAVLERAAALDAVRPHLRLGHRVRAIAREGLLKHQAIASADRADRPFRLLVDGPDGERIDHADVVIDATGTYDQPNRTGDGGIEAPGEAALDGRIVRHIPDVLSAGEPSAQGPWAGSRILLIGAGHSAQATVLDLAELVAEHPGTRVIWALRRSEPVWSTIPNDALPARSALIDAAQQVAQSPPAGLSLKTGVAVERFAADGDGVRVTLRRHPARNGDGDTEDVVVDRVVSLTGYVPDHLLYRQLQVHECYATSGPMKLAAALLGEVSADCMAQTTHGADTLKNPEPGFFILGAKSYGRNTTFLMRVGWQQVDEVFGLLEES